MERLTERTADGILVKENYEKETLKTLYSCYGEKPNPHYTNCEEGYCAMEKLADYEDAEEQGRLVILPCKVGDTLYRLVPNLYREYVEIKIAQFVINKNGIYFITDKGVSWSADKIGKTVFLTKSEAEQKLKGMESD